MPRAERGQPGVLHLVGDRGQAAIRAPVAQRAGRPAAELHRDRQPRPARELLHRRPSVRRPSAAPARAARAGRGSASERGARSGRARARVSGSEPGVAPGPEREVRFSRLRASQRRAGRVGVRVVAAASWPTGSCGSGRRPSRSAAPSRPCRPGWRRRRSPSSPRRRRRVPAAAARATRSRAPRRARRPPAASRAGPAGTRGSERRGESVRSPPRASAPSGAVGYRHGRRRDPPRGDGAHRRSDPHRHRQPARQRGAGRAPADGRTSRPAGVECELASRMVDRPNLVARIRGTGDGPSLALCGHTDVVPADEPGWTHPPFAGHVDDEGWLWGRGAVDMKNQTATRAVAMAILARSGFKPKGDLLFIAQADEEDGVEGVGMRWLVGARPDLRVDYAIDEGGGDRLVLADGRIVVPIECGAEGDAAGWRHRTGRGRARLAAEVGGQRGAAPGGAGAPDRRVRPERQVLPATARMLDVLVGPGGDLEERIARASGSTRRSRDARAAVLHHHGPDAPAGLQRAQRHARARDVRGRLPRAARHHRGRPGARAARGSGRRPAIRPAVARRPHRRRLVRDRHAALPCLPELPRRCRPRRDPAADHLRPASPTPTTCARRGAPSPTASGRTARLRSRCTRTASTTSTSASTPTTWRYGVQAMLHIVREMVG